MALAQDAVTMLASKINPRNFTEEGREFKNVYFLQNKGDFAEVEAKEKDEISCFCHPGMEAALPRFWSSVSFNLDIDKTAVYSV